MKTGIGITRGERLPDERAPETATSAVGRIAFGVILLLLPACHISNFTLPNGAEAVGYNAVGIGDIAIGIYLIYRGIGPRNVLRLVILGPIAFVSTTAFYHLQTLDVRNALMLAVATCLAGVVLVGAYSLSEKPRWPWSRFTLVALVCGAALAACRFEFRQPPFRESDLPAMSAQAAGKEPIPQPDSDAKRLIRAYLKDILLLRAQAMDDSGKLDTSEMSQLFRASSFVSRRSIQTMLDELRQRLALSTKLAAMPALALQRFTAGRKAMLGSTDSAYLLEVESGAAQSMRKHAPFHKKEQEMIAAEIDLYGFALQHSDAFAVANGQLVISDNNTLQTFNAKWSNVGHLVAEYNAMRKQFTSDFASDSAAQSAVEGLGVNQPRL